MKVEQIEDCAIHNTFKPFVRVDGKFNCPEMVKTIVMLLFVFPIRLLLALLILLVCYLLARISLCGLDTNSTQKLTRWRSALVWCICKAIWLSCRICFGFVVREIYLDEFPGIDSESLNFQSANRASIPDVPAAIVSNHLGYYDVLLLLGHFRAGFVAGEAVKSVWFIGVIAKALQCVFLAKSESVTQKVVERAKVALESQLTCTSMNQSGALGDMGDWLEAQQYENSRSEFDESQTKIEDLVDELKPLPKKKHKYYRFDNRTSNHAHTCCSNAETTIPPLIVFPEGTTTNGFAMCEFRTGIFTSGLPIRPVAIRFPFRHFNPSWESIYFTEHIIRSMTQIVNWAEILIMPVYIPSPEEINSPKTYASNVQRVISQCLNLQVLPLTRRHKFVYHDFLLGKLTEQEALDRASIISLESK